MKKTGIHDRFYALLEQLPGATKEQLVWQYSGMLTESLREFYSKNPDEYKRMLADLQLRVYKMKGINPVDPMIKVLRSAVLLRMQKHGVDTTEKKCINDFLMQPRIAGKLLYEMDITELRKLVAKLEMILQKDAERQTEEIRLSESN
ncbi:MAG TPA: hypothetical protein VK207_08990 [Bacteroidales bacterium]|nr:hypothetical protein [Bacteroidales bacterium]